MSDEEIEALRRLVEAGWIEVGDQGPDGSYRFVLVGPWMCMGEKLDQHWTPPRTQPKKRDA